MDTRDDINSDTSKHHAAAGSASNTSTINTENKNKQYVYDAQLRCYFDPETNEYFEMKNQ